MYGVGRSRRVAFLASIRPRRGVFCCCPRSSEVKWSGVELGVGADVVAKGMMVTFCWEGERGFSHTSVFPLVCPT